MICPGGDTKGLAQQATQIQDGELCEKRGRCDHSAFSFKSLLAEVSMKDSVTSWDRQVCYASGMHFHSSR